MQQQINLYRYLPRPVKSLLTADAIAKGYLVFLGVLFISTIHSLWHNHSLNLQNKELMTQLTESQTMLNETHLRYPSINIKEVGLHVENMKQSYEEKQRIYLLLSHTLKFSQYMYALANSTVPGTWLTDFIFSASSQSVILKGAATQSSSLEAFLEQLKQQPVFSELDFELSELNQAKENNMSVLTFNIQSKATEL